jgi:hypothetical protein
MKKHPRPQGSGVLHGVGTTNRLLDLRSKEQQPGNPEGNQQEHQKASNASSKDPCHERNQDHVHGVEKAHWRKTGKKFGGTGVISGGPSG